jgi:hypothetical protein
MSNSIQIRVEELNALPATKIVENEKVEQKFIGMYNAIWGTDMGEQIYNREKFHFNLKSATPFPKCYLHKEKWTFDS